MRVSKKTPTWTYSCGYSSGIAPDSHIKVFPAKEKSTNAAKV
jgi:hypothetical protein